MCVTVDISNMWKTYLDTAESPMRRSNMWNKWICFTYLISWIISRINSDFNLAHHTESFDVFGEKKIIVNTKHIHTYPPTHTHSCMRQFNKERVRLKGVERRDQSVWLGLMEERRLELHLERIIITEALKRILGIYWAGGSQLRERGQ